jgi:hypothetical protein
VIQNRSVGTKLFQRWLPRVKTVNSASDNLLSREGEKSCLSLSKAESVFSSGLSFAICNQNQASPAIRWINRSHYLWRR